MRFSHFQKITNAPSILFGAFFLCASCKPQEVSQERPPKPPESSEEEAAATPEEPAQASPKSPEASTGNRFLSFDIKTIPPESSEEEAVITPEEPAQTSFRTPEASTGIRFLSFNIKNYLTMERYVRNGPRQLRSKPEEEIEALIEQIISQQPDILGICEIGTLEDLADLQARLKAAGLDLPHTEHAGGRDQTRHLAILSKLPISARHSEHHLPFELSGQDFLMGRGILDVVIDLPNGPTHFIGVHLKSKRPIQEADQAMVRLNEARLLREHCDRIFEKNKEARLIVYGDMNETKGEAPIKMIKGPGNSDGFLEDVYVKDARGEVWTHFWKYQHQYARFDYVFISRSVKPEINFKQSYIVDPINFYDASDHRAIMVTIGREE